MESGVCLYTCRCVGEHSGGHLDTTTEPYQGVFHGEATLPVLRREETRSRLNGELRRLNICSPLPSLSIGAIGSSPAYFESVHQRLPDGAAWR